ncbi:MAG TPA: ABC transporter ATP-binding protein/permease [Stellaceae bacterium]|nr:ABC transporter ATP-binding protein/permease [Stellaceae bacterium]
MRSVDRRSPPESGGKSSARLRDGMRALRRLLPYLLPRGQAGLHARLGAAVACVVAAKLVNVLVPLLYKATIDALTPGTGATQGTDLVHAAAVPIGLIVGYAFARVGAQAFGELRDAVFARVAQRTVRTVSLEVFRHLHDLSLRFHLERQTGGLGRAIDRGTAAIGSVLGFMLFNILPTLFEIGLVAVVLWRLYGAALALATLGTILAYVGFTIAVTEWRVQFRRTMNERDAEANTRAVDSLLNFETVKYFANEALEADRFDQAKQAYETAAVKSQRTLSLLNLGQGGIVAGGLVVVMVLAARGIVDGRMTLGDFVLVNSYMIQLYLPLNALGIIYRNVKQSLIDLEAMFALLDIRPEVEDRPTALPLANPIGTVASPSFGRVVFDRVSFAYDQRRPILRDLSFTVEAGKRVAIVGPSGAGKSTIARLLFRFWDVDEGAITIDGQDLRDVTQASLRRAIGVVPQDTVLFNDTIRYNIRYGRPEASDAELREAARQARIDDFIMRLPDGYETRVGERGLKLSGGEKQRVAIARVILKRPRLLIFDEATSALDSATEQQILISLDELSTARTTLIIAHRLSTVIDADEILVLDHGRIVERGPHAALVRRDGAYAALWARQHRPAEDEVAPD